MIKLNISSVITVIIVMNLLFSCSQEPKGFSINENDLTQLLDDESYRNDFIKRWKLKLCFQNDVSVRYCFKDSLIQFEMLEENGYILSVNNLEFLELDSLVSDLNKNYNSQNIKELEGYQKHLGMYNLSFGQYFTNSKFEIMVTTQEVQTNEVYTITVNRSGT